MRKNIELLVLGLLLIAVIQPIMVTYAGPTTTIAPEETPATKSQNPIVAKNISVRTYHVVVDNVDINYTVILALDKTCNGYMWIFVKTARCPDGSTSRSIFRACEGEIVNPIVINAEFTTTSPLWTRAVMEAVVKSILTLKINNTNFTWFSIPFAEIVSPEDRVIAVMYVLGDKVYEVIYDFDNHRVLATGENLFSLPYQYPWLLRTATTVTMLYATGLGVSETTTVSPQTTYIHPGTSTTKATPETIGNIEAAVESAGGTKNVYGYTTNLGYAETNPYIGYNIEKIVIIVLVSITVALISYIFVKRIF